MFLDGIKLRKLENGYTIKFHVETEPRKSADVAPAGFSKELYVKDKAALATTIAALVEQYIDELERVTDREEMKV